MKKKPGGESVHEILSGHFEKKQKANPGFSMRSLARTLDVSPSFVSRIFKGGRSIPYSMLSRLAEALDIDAEIFSKLKNLYLEEGGEVSAPKRDKLKVKTQLADWELPEKAGFLALKQWFYLPLLEMTTFAGFDGSSTVIAQRLGLAKETVEVALRELESVGLLKIEDGIPRKIARKLRWSTVKFLPAVRVFHDQMLARAQNLLRHEPDTDEHARRLITGLVVATTPEKIQKAKERLSDFLHELAEDLMDVDEPSEVYSLGAQLIPLTKKDSGPR